MPNSLIPIPSTSFQTATRLLTRILGCLLLAAPTGSLGGTFTLPTPNKAIYEAGGGGRYFVGTVGRTWESGTFGCVRSDGLQLHEGLDIRCVSRDKAGEPVDAVFAVAPGKVVYTSSSAGLSSYGKYVVVEHMIEGIPLYGIYAHLREFEAGIQRGRAVKAGQQIATMGRTSNTRQAISKERAHLHLELALKLSGRFDSWHKTTYRGTRNDHGEWNGRNFAGIDPLEALLADHKLGEKFSLLDLIRNRREMCRVFVRDHNFDWLKRYYPLVVRNPKADQEGAAGYEIVLDAYGLPFRMIPRAPSEVEPGDKITLLSVDEAEQRAHPCKKLVVKSGKSGWQLTASGRQLVELLIH